MKYIENKTYEELEVGATASLKHTLTQKDIELFAVMSGDVNPAHVDAEYAKDDMFHKIIAHGMWGASFISTVLSTELPGPGTIYLDQTLKFLQAYDKLMHANPPLNKSQLNQFCLSLLGL